MRLACIAPGSRSTPLALALMAAPGIKVELFHDERSAAFAALGFGIATGTPALVVCTSGTAAAHFYAAVIEADASAVPLIICSADRPPELWGRGAPQTIDQTELYGTRVREFVEPGPPDTLDPEAWRPLARRLVQAATGQTPGPVHANLSFRDPLTGTPGVLPSPLDEPAIASTEPPASALVDDIVRRLSNGRGVIIAGRNESSATDILDLAAKLGWPVIADHRSGCRAPDDVHVLRHFDAILRSATFANAHQPDVVLRIGEIVSSKSTSQWLTASAAAGADVLASQPHGRFIDPEAISSLSFDEAHMLHAINERLTTDAACDAAWLDRWVRADQVATSAVQAVLDRAQSPTEIEIAQVTLSALPVGGALVVSSSMPVRDIEWFGPHRSDINVISNRGANGIDGVVATAVGVALSGSPTVCLIGDVAFLHDATTLTALHQRNIDLTIVVIDNDGGGIFSFLPQHQLLDDRTYEQLFGTPHGTDLMALVRAHGLPCELFDSADLTPAGPRVFIAQSDRSRNLAIHDETVSAVNNALVGMRDHPPT